MRLVCEYFIGVLIKKICMVKRFVEMWNSFIKVKKIDRFLNEETSGQRNAKMSQ